METHKTFLLTILLLYSFQIFCNENKIKLKVNRVGTVSLVNPSYENHVDSIYIDGVFVDGDTISANVNDVESEITLIWYKDLDTCNSMFASLSHITEIDLSDFDTSKVTDMQSMFYKCTSLKSIKFVNIDTSKVKSMLNMFANCSSLTFFDVSGFQTSNVEDMEGMFYACYSLVSLDLSNFDTSSNKYVYKMFMDCFNLKYLDLNGFKTSKVGSFRFMFSNCSSLKSLDLSSFDTSIAYNTDYMFYGCTSLTSLNLSNFVTNDIYNMEYMFAECRNLSYINFQNLIEKPDSYYGYQFFSKDNILYNTPHNLVVCFNKNQATLFNSIFSNKNCEIIDCTENWKEKQSKINAVTGLCMASCNSNGYNLYDYNNKCYSKCPDGTKENNNEYICDMIIKEINEKIDDNLIKENIEEENMYEENIEFENDIKMETILFKGIERNIEENECMEIFSDILSYQNLISHSEYSNEERIKEDDTKIKSDIYLFIDIEENEEENFIEIDTDIKSDKNFFNDIIEYFDKDEMEITDCQEIVLEEKQISHIKEYLEKEKTEQINIFEYKEKDDIIFEEKNNFEINIEIESNFELSIIEEKDEIEMNENELLLENNNEIKEIEKLNKIYEEISENNDVKKMIYNTYLNLYLYNNNISHIDMKKETIILIMTLNTENLNNCSINSFLKNECKVFFKSDNQKKNFINEIITKLKDGSLESAIKLVVNENEIIFIENEDEIYSISTLTNQNYYKKSTIVDLAECENILRDVYNLE